jgi:predicted  nucleic acid-binding Zn-ribbon protein
MSNLTAAASEIRKISKAFAGLAELGSAIDSALQAETAVTLVEKQLAELNKKIAKVQAQHDVDEAAFAKHYADLQKNALNAEDAAKDELAKIKADGAEALKKAKDKLADIKEATDSAVKAYENKTATAEKLLKEKEEAVAVADKKLSDINAAIAAIAGR